MISRPRPTPDQAQRLLKDVYAPIAAELVEAEKIFATELGSRLQVVQHLVDHCAHLRGKRLRPALLLLTAQACGGIRPDHLVLAAVVEMIHTATLVHDDVLDEALIRRHAATVNAEWGNETAVLLGDYLFTHAFHLAASLESTLACRWIGRATNLVCEGEMQQVFSRGNLELDESDYLAIIRGKTAELTAISCRLGAHFASAPPDMVEALSSFGRDLGVAFQITDDVLDICGEERTTGKTLGTDLEKQKLTLPLIRLLRTVPTAEAERIRDLFTEDHSDRRRALRPLIEASDAVDYSWHRAQELAARAADALECLPDSPARSVLQTMTTFVVARVS
jgi:octaprenyl-diphosphate synthase